MSELQVIEHVLTRAARRQRWQTSFHRLGQGLLLGSLVLFFVLALYKLLPVPAWMPPAAGGLAMVLALAGFVRGYWRKPSLLQTARWIDDRRQLKERLSSALEVSGAALPTEWKQLLLADAAVHACELNPREFIPLALPRLARWALLTFALCVGLGFVPAYRSAAHVRKQEEAAVMKDVGRNLADLMRHELVQKPPVLPPTQQSMQQVAAFGDQLGKQTLTRSEALRDLTSMTDRLAKQEEALAHNPALKALERAAREPGTGAASSPDALHKQIDAMQKALGDAAGNMDKIDKLSKSLENLKQQAANAAAKDGLAGSAAREQLAQSLADLARQAREAGASPESIEEAIQALASNKADLFLKDLEAASHDLEKLKDLAKAMQQLQEQAAKVGRDLPEQLDKGQGQAAVQSLRKMIEQLKAGNLSREQMQQLADEVQRAVKPGSQYGKVGELLDKAARQAKSGNGGNTAQQLADAQRELEKLLDQMADADSLQSTLDALARAQAALSQIKSWGQCSGTGFRPGGRPGRGVGTWADDYGWTYINPPQDAGWDNSGIQRPDMDPRGESARLADLNPNLKPDKIKGQLTPGGSMPSITLKGVSIKGTSTVKFEEAAAAAQKDAQSALNQDQVPRAYQNGVRDYFDDLKK